MEVVDKESKNLYTRSKKSIHKKTISLNYANQYIKLNSLELLQMWMYLQVTDEANVHLFKTLIKTCK